MLLQQCFYYYNLKMFFLITIIQKLKRFWWSAFLCLLISMYRGFGFSQALCFVMIKKTIRETYILYGFPRGAKLFYKLLGNLDHRENYPENWIRLIAISKHFFLLSWKFIWHFYWRFFNIHYRLTIMMN